MKKFRMFMFTAAVCLSVAPFLTSCEVEGNVDELPRDNSGVAGTYKLTSYGINNEDDANPGTYIPADADLNGDGVASHDLTAESTCYGESYIRINNDHSYARFYTYPDGEGGCLTAFKEAGTWTKTDNTITFLSSDSNGDPNEAGMDIFTTELTLNGGTLTTSREEVDNFVGTGFGIGRVDFSYTKLSTE